MNSTRLNKNADTNMTGRVGTLYLDRSLLVKALGKPPFSESADGKITMEWVMETPNGVATLYDYWWNAEGEWSIGGHTGNVVSHVQAFVEAAHGAPVEAHEGMTPPAAL